LPDIPLSVLGLFPLPPKMKDWVLLLNKFRSTNGQPGKSPPRLRSFPGVFFPPTPEEPLTPQRPRLHVLPRRFEGSYPRVRAPSSPECIFFLRNPPLRFWDRDSPFFVSELRSASCSGPFTFPDRDFFVPRPVFPRLGEKQLSLLPAPFLNHWRTFSPGWNPLFDAPA